MARSISIATNLIIFTDEEGNQIDSIHIKDGEYIAASQKYTELALSGRKVVAFRYYDHGGRICKTEYYGATINV